VRFGDFYEWEVDAARATAHIFAFGREVAVRVSSNATLRTARIPLPWPVSVKPQAFGWGLGAAACAALLLMLARIGALEAMAARPAASATSLLVSVTLLAQPAWAGGGPPKLGDGGNTWVRRWISHDHLGNAILYTDASGGVVKRRIFDPFGGIAGESADTEATRRLFTGQQWWWACCWVREASRWSSTAARRFPRSMGARRISRWRSQPRTWHSRWDSWWPHSWRVASPSELAGKLRLASSSLPPAGCARARVRSTGGRFRLRRRISRGRRSPKVRKESLDCQITRLYPNLRRRFSEGGSPLWIARRRRSRCRATRVSSNASLHTTRIPLPWPVSVDPCRGTGY
jgi:hypothetical protein